MLKVCAVALLFMVLLYVTSSLTCIFAIAVAGILFAIFNDFHGNISVLDHFVQKTKTFLWKVLQKGAPPTVTYKESFWDMDKFNKSPSGSFYNWGEKSECFSPIYTSRLLPKYRTFAKATSTPLNSPRATPPPPERLRYSFTRNHQAKAYSDNCEASPKSASRTWSNLNLSTYADSRSYGLASRIVDYNAREEERDNRSTYKAQRAFPIVRLFKKELPVISAKPNTVTVHIAQPDSANYEAEQRKLILQSIMQEKQQPRPAENTETRSVLDALKEISRKRIHPDDELNIIQNGTSSPKKPGDSCNYPTNSKRTKEDLGSQEAKRTSEKRKSDPKIPYVDPITASLTSSDKEFERELLGKKRKAKRDSYESQKSSKVLKLHSVETQTTNDLLPDDQPKDFQKTKDVEMENARGDSPEPVTKQQSQNPVLKVFDDKPLEINRKKRLALMLGALSGQAPDFGSLDGPPPSETHSILSPANKSKQEKHVTFNETVEIRKIVSDDDLTKSKSQQITPLSEPTQTSLSTFTSLNSPTTSSTTISASNQATTTSTFSLPNPLLSSSTALAAAANPLPENNQFKIQENSNLELVPQTKTVDQPKSGGFKFDLKAPTTSQPQTNFFLPAASSSSDSSLLQFKGPANVTVSKENSSNFTPFESTAPTTPPKLAIADKTETPKSSTVAPKAEFNFQAGGTQTLPSTSNMPSVTFTPPSTTKPVQFGSTTTTTTPSIMSPFGGGTTFGKGPSESSSPFNKNVASTTPSSLFKSKDTSVTSSSFPFALPTTSTTAPAQPSGFGTTSSVTISPFGTSTTSITTKTTTPAFGSFTTQSSTTPGGTTSFGFVSSTSSTKPGTFSFAGGASSAPSFGTDKAPSFNFGGSVGTTTAITTGTSAAPPAFGKVSTTAPNIFGNTLSPASAPFKSTTTSTTSGTIGFGSGTGTTQIATTSSFGSPAVTTSSAFGGTTFGNSSTGTSFTSGSKFPQTGFGSSNPTTKFSSNTQPLPLFGASTTSAFAPSTTQSSTFGANTSFGASSQPAPTFGSGTPGFGSGTQPTTSSVFGGSFGSGTTSAPTFGSSAPQTSAPTFGNSSGTTTFGSSTFGTSTFGPNTTQTGFGSSSTPNPFGQAAPAPAPAPLPAFGSNLQSGFGTTVTQPSFGSSFGTAPQSTFGTSTTQATGFGSNTQQPFGSGGPPQTGFGTSTGQQPLGFGSPNAQSGFGGSALPPPTPFGPSTQSAFGATTQPQTFSFGGGAAPSPSSGVFPFGSTNDPNKPVPNFSAGSTFGAPQQPFNAPNFNAPAAPGMFSIGSGGSSTAKSRSGRSRRRV